jgi:hypothetical protein
VPSIRTGLSAAKNFWSPPPSKGLAYAWTVSCKDARPRVHHACTFRNPNKEPQGRKQAVCLGSIGCWAWPSYCVHPCCHLDALICAECPTESTLSFTTNGAIGCSLEAIWQRFT